MCDQLFRIVSGLQHQITRSSQHSLFYPYRYYRLLTISEQPTREHRDSIAWYYRERKRETERTAKCISIMYRDLHANTYGAGGKSDNRKMAGIDIVDSTVDNHMCADQNIRFACTKTSQSGWWGKRCANSCVPCIQNVHELLFTEDTRETCTNQLTRILIKFFNTIIHIQDIYYYFV